MDAILKSDIKSDITFGIRIKQTIWIRVEVGPHKDLKKKIDWVVSFISKEVLA